MRKNAGAVIKYILYDGHGSTRQLVDNNEDVTDAFSYDGYGVMLGANPASAATSLLYTGEMYDSYLQHYYLRARWYNPANGRFNRMDPFAGNNQDPQSLHKYLYCSCNPINNIDPTGKLFLLDFLQRTVVQNLLMHVAMPTLAPLINEAASLLIPPEVREAIEKLLHPSAIVGGAGRGINAGYYVGAGVVGGGEVLWSPNTRRSAVYGYSGWALGIMAGGGVGGGIAAYAGLVYGARSSLSYTGTFHTITIPL